MKPLGALGRGPCPAPSAPSSLCFLVQESQDFNSTSSRNVLNCQLLVVGRLKNTQSDLKSRTLHHQLHTKHVFLMFRSFSLVRTQVCKLDFTHQKLQSTVFAVYTAEQIASTVPQLARAQSGFCRPHKLLSWQKGVFNQKGL